MALPAYVLTICPHTIPTKEYGLLKGKWKFSGAFHEHRCKNTLKLRIGKASDCDTARTDPK
jgi:hypothetical protein